jgi:1,4-dihydroxy-2-naphthoate octaprenyltransferase
MNFQTVTNWKTWIIAVRPFAFPASVAPVLIGTTLAAVLAGRPVSPLLFVAALSAMMLLHAGANILSDINDFKRGLDKEPTPVSGAIVRGLMSPRAALVEALILLSAGAALGLALAYLTTPTLLLVGALGVAIGVFYAVPPISLKYRALGDAAVFLNFGLLGSLGAWMVQTRQFSWAPVVHAIPIGLLVVGILHANNWRDSLSDRQAGIRTVAAALGDRGSLVYYALLIFVPFLFVTAAVGLTRGTRSALPAGVLLIWLALPNAWSCWRKALRRREPRRPQDFVTLDAATAQLNILFGLLYVAGAFAHYFWSRSG